MLLHEATEPGQICSNTWDTHDGTLGGGVAPGLVVGGEHAHMATAHEFLQFVGITIGCGQRLDP